MGDESDRLMINVGGISFETYISTLQNIPDTRLAWLTEGLDPDPSNRKEIFFDRHSGVFVHILNYYRTGKLHTPTDICGPLFEEELNFWGIDEKQMEPCCWESFTKHREAEVNLKSFEGPGFDDLKNAKQRKLSSFSLRDGLNCRERMDQIWYIMDRPHSSNIAKYTSILSCFMIVLSVTVYCLNTLPDLKNLSTWISTRSAIDIFCMCWFTLEFAIRILVCPDRKAFVQSASNWIDFLSVIPSYLKLFSINDTWLINLVIIRLLRLFRFFKLSYGLQVLLHTLKASFYELVLLLLILSIPIVIFSSLVHTVESNLSNGSEKFISIPATFWWCLITMTSVGYGDMVPETWAGKIVGGICAICGVLIVALPISVIGSNFSLYYAHVRARLKLPTKDRKLLAGNIRGLLKQPLSLSSRERDRRGLKRNNMPAIRRKGSSKANCKTESGIQISRSITSDNESLDDNSVVQVNSSEQCLAWDCTADSGITFTQTTSGNARKKGNRREAITELYQASDCDEAVASEDNEQKIPFLRTRRERQTMLNVKENFDEIGNEQSSQDEGLSNREIASSEDSSKSFLNGKYDLIANAENLRHDNDVRSGPMVRSASNRCSSRRNSMKLMNLNVLPDEKDDILNAAHERKRRETVTSTDEPMLYHHKKKKTKTKRPSKSFETKTKNSIPAPSRRRRDGVLCIDIEDRKTYNGFLSDSSERDCSPGEPPGLNCSPASPGLNVQPINAQTGHSSARNSLHNQSFHSDENVASELMSKLKWLAVRRASCHGIIANSTPLEEDFYPKCSEIEKLSNQSRIVVKHLPSSVMTQNRANLDRTRKKSRSELDLRTNSRVLRDVLVQERLPCIRQISSDIDVRLLESGV